jgi:nucleolar protein 56
MRAIGVLDELDRTINTLSEHMREWYGLYFPEADKLIQSHEQLARMIHEHGEREAMKDERLQKYSKISAGMPFSDEDLLAVREFAKSISNLNKTRAYVSEYIRKSCKDAMPNLTAIAGPLIACRLLSAGGGLEKLSKMSSSTIQLLGAEKALFRHLRGQGRAPKFGVIFAHPSVQKARREDRGRVARILASKLTMAARADFYTGKDISEKLMKDVRDKLRVNRNQKSKKKNTNK